MTAILLKYTAFILVIMVGPTNAPLRVGGYPDKAQCLSAGADFTRTMTEIKVGSAYACIPVNEPAPRRPK